MLIMSTLGGVGLFLLGMEIMTAALREMAGSGLRRSLAGLTASPLRGAMTGAFATAAIQSSSAVTLITIGAVGAGLLSFGQALGVLFGANVGTTVTGWIVMILGIKFQLGVVALPLLFAASLLSLMGRGHAARIGRALSGFALLFIGLDMMETATSGAQVLLHPDMLPDDSWTGRLLLMGMGLALVALIQSSSAGMALVLVLLGSGSVSFAQAAALVIGFDMGTTVTGLLAAFGGPRAMRLTALANLFFNIGTAALAFPLLDVVIPMMRGFGLGADDQLALVIFHTGFNILGAAVFIPFTAKFASLVERLVPVRRVPLAEGLDRRLLVDEGAALDAAQGVANRLRATLFEGLARALEPQGDMRGLASASDQGTAALAALQDYLGRVRITPERRREQEHYVLMLHQMDHFQRLLERCAQRDRIASLSQEPLLRRDMAALAAALRRGDDAARLLRLSDLINRRSARFHRGALLREHVGLISMEEVFARTDALRWLGRVAEHAARIALHAQEAKTVT